MRQEWEDINSTTARLMVPGGWLYRIANYPIMGKDTQIQVVFISDESVLDKLARMGK